MTLTATAAGRIILTEKSFMEELADTSDVSKFCSRHQHHHDGTCMYCTLEKLNARV